MDDVGEHVARRLLRLGRVDARQVVGFAACGPGLKPLRPGVELFRRIAGLEFVIALLQPRIDEIAGDVGDGWILAMFGENHRRLELPYQGDELRHREAVVPNFDDMAQRAAVEFARQQLEELAEIGRVEFLGRRELPEHRTQPVAEFQHPGIVEALHRIAGLRQHAAIGGEARPLQRKHETIGHLARPFAKTLRLLRPVVSPVDLDRGQLRRGIGKFLRLRQLLRIKHPAPRLESPAADADIDVAAAVGWRLRGLAHGGLIGIERGGVDDLNHIGPDWPVFRRE